jgi:SAM-dependent methyltransferase
MLSNGTVAAPIASPGGPLGDSVNRDYSRKLQLFNRFARPEIRTLISHLKLAAGVRILDAGCGTGENLECLQSAVGAKGAVLGIDLSAAHVAVARAGNSAGIEVMQGDLMHAELAPASFDLIWCANTIHHMSDPLLAIQKMTPSLRPRGRIALLQSSFLAEMFFAWDARLEQVTNEAVRSYYRDRYRLDERESASVRAIVGLLRRAQLKNVSARSVLIERIAPLDAATENYLREAIFRDTWGERLRPYLPADDYEQLLSLCAPDHAAYALRRPDFHFLQSLTLATGEIPS